MVSHLKFFNALLHYIPAKNDIAFTFIQIHIYTITINTADTIHYTCTMLYYATEVAYNVCSLNTQYLQLQSYRMTKINRWQSDRMTCFTIYNAPTLSYEEKSLAIKPDTLKTMD